MGNGETRRPSRLSDSAKASPNMEERRSSAGITAKSHRTQSFPSNDNLMGHPHHHHRPLLSSPNGADDDEDDGGGRGSSGSGPSQNDSGPNEVERSTTPTPKPPNYNSCYHSSSTGPSSCSSTPTSTSTGLSFPDHVVLVANNGSATAGLAAATATTLQPFDSLRSITNTASKSPGGGVGMAAASAALGFPFTAAQRRELERQAMIYKYMIASAPVPSDLLLPADPTAAPLLLGGSHGGGSSTYNLRYGNRDLEPGRCKRTDGKKWRCSRDVAPHQKYCERHMHRGRPRSRKPVEQLQSSSISPDNPNSSNINKKSRLHRTPLHPNPPTIAQPNNHSSPQFLGTGTIQQPKDPQLLDASVAHNSIFASSYNYKEPNRVFGWAVDGEVVAANRVEQELLHLMDTKRREGLAPIQDYIYGTNASTLQQGYGEEEPLNLFSYATEIAYPGGVHSRNGEYHMFLNSDLIASKQPQIDQHCTSRGFIDAWSNGDLKAIDESSAPSSKGDELSPSSLKLSMAMVAGNALDEGMGLAAASHPREPKDCPVSWLPFTSGGPLAEVLQPNSVACGSNPASPCASNGNSVSLPATTVSSPTGIVHKALFSQSDGSVCNSPTLAASAAPPEVVAFQWLD